MEGKNENKDLYAITDEHYYFNTLQAWKILSFSKDAGC